jgi:hypothetical protein
VGDVEEGKPGKRTGPDLKSVGASSVGCKSSTFRQRRKI